MKLGEQLEWKSAERKLLAHSCQNCSHMQIVSTLQVVSHFFASFWEWSNWEPSSSSDDVEIEEKQVHRQFYQISLFTFPWRLRWNPLPVWVSTWEKNWKNLWRVGKQEKMQILYRIWVNCKHCLWKFDVDQWRNITSLIFCLMKYYLQL